MPKISFKGSEAGEGWSPLPQGDYVLQVEDVAETMSSNNNEQLKVSCIVVEGNNEGQKCTLWFPLMAKAGFRLRGFVEAAIPDKCEISETDEETERGDKLAEIDFDTDDLIGAQVLCTATIRNDNNGNPQNDFKNFRSASGESAEAAEDEAPVAPPPKRNAAPATRTPASNVKPIANKAAPAAAPSRERRRLG